MTSADTSPRDPVRIHEYRGFEVTVTWDSSLCQHAAACVRGLPQVFDTNERPWVQPDAADAAAVRAVIATCPSGALRYH